MPNGALPAALCIAAVCAAPAIAAPSGPCADAPCQASLTVGADTVRFATQERFYPSEQNFSVRLSTAGGALEAVRRVRGCETHYAGPGMRATLVACAEGAPLRLFAHRTWGGTTTLRITYRAVADGIPQGVKGVSSGSGGTGPSRGGGVGPA